MTPHAAAPLVLLALACGGKGPTLALRYHPPAGAVYQFGIEQRVILSAESGPLARMGRRQMLMHVFFTQTVKGPVSGGTEVEVLFESLTMEVPGVPAGVIGQALAGLQGMRATMVLDGRGAVVRSDLAQVPGVPPDVAKRIAAGVNSMTFGFPEEPVGRGDAWTITSELPLDEVPGISASTTELARTTLTVREIRVEGADTSVVLDIRTAFPSDPIRLASTTESGTLVFEGGMTGSQVFSISRGAVVDGAMKGTMRVTVKGSGLAPEGMTIRTENEQSIALLPGK